MAGSYSKRDCERGQDKIESKARMCTAKKSPIQTSIDMCNKLKGTMKSYPQEGESNKAS